MASTFLPEERRYRLVLMNSREMRLGVFQIQFVE